MFNFELFLVVKVYYIYVRVVNDFDGLLLCINLIVLVLRRLKLEVLDIGNWVVIVIVSIWFLMEFILVSLI